MTTLGTTIRNLLNHRGQDTAAGLTYYSMLAIFPALLALTSLLGLVGDTAVVVDAVLDVLKPLVSADTLADVEPILTSMADSSGATATFVIGLVAAFWSASSYVGCFGRAMNTVREVEETRPLWVVKPLMLLITVLSVLMVAVGLVIVVASGPIAQSLAVELGIDQQVVDIYEIAKWPLLLLMVVLVVGLLFKATPNVRTGPWYRLLTLGSFVAILAWILATTGFSFYVANFGAYNKTYGSIAGVIVGLIWLWITNLALLFGAELDATRARSSSLSRRGESPEPADHTVETGELAALIAAPPAGVLAPKDKVVLRESFPRQEGAPPYGPITQPVPDED